MKPFLFFSGARWVSAPGGFAISSVSSGKNIVYPCQPNDSFSCLRGVRRCYTKATARRASIRCAPGFIAFLRMRKNRRNRRSCKDWKPLRRFCQRSKKRPGKQPRRFCAAFLENPKKRSIFAPFDANGNTLVFGISRTCSHCNSCRFFFCFQ